MDRSIARTSGSGIVAALAAISLLAWGAWTSILLSRADWLFRRNTCASVKQAVGLDPKNGRYLAWLAELLENEGSDSAPALEAAARLNPMNSRVWIRRGLNAELAGECAAAERFLLHAAAIDRLMEPRWTLMNFYFRQGSSENFWRWAKQTFAMSYGDRTLLFELCWRARPDAQQIASLSDDPATLKQFVRFLMLKGQPAAASEVALRTVPAATPPDLPIFNDCLERLLAVGGATPAVALWNALCNRRLLPYLPLDPRRGISLTNGEFTVFPTGAAFDWRVEAGEGISAVRIASPGSLRLSLSGRQADSCRMLSETVPLLPERRYRLWFRYQTTGLEAQSGIRIRAAGAVSPDLLSADWRRESLEFSSGAQSLEHIVLDYQRPHGFTRHEGSITLAAMRLELAQ